MVVDYNKIQALDYIDNILSLGDLSAKFCAFGFNVLEVKDGHNFTQLKDAFDNARSESTPTVILCHTVKGKGVPEFENDPVWHAKKVKNKDLTIGLKRLLDEI